MERLQSLIDKLNEQCKRQETDKMLFTAQLLLCELQQMAALPCTESTQRKVAVVLPTAIQVKSSEETIVPVEHVVKERKKEYVKTESPAEWAFDPMLVVPTLVQQNKREVFELNDVMLHEEETLNHKLKEEKTEISAVLQGMPIHDLKKAIGINDRYTFINELFRGDEVMYERSIKTINSFSIYPEAEYWIQRELKVKLGWDEQSETVKIFDQLVKRRFS